MLLCARVQLSSSMASFSLCASMAAPLGVGSEQDIELCLRDTKRQNKQHESAKVVREAT